MKPYLKIVLFLTLIFALAIPGTGQAKGLYDDEVVFGGNFVLESGETLNGNLIVFGGNATLEDGSQVNGDVIMMGGNLEVDGDIDGNIIAFGGNVDLLDSAVVTGDVSMMGGSISRSVGAIVEGDVTRDFTGPFRFNFPRNFRAPFFPLEYSPFNLMASFVWFLLRVFLWAALAVLLVMFAPRHVERAAQTAVNQPLVAGGVGLLTVIVVPLLLLVLAITIILIPATLFGALILVVAWAFGLISLGTEVGRRLAHMVDQVWAPPVSAGIGTFVLMLVINGIGEIVPCVGWVVPVAVGLVGLGAVVLSRFGTTIYPPAAPPPAVRGVVPPPPPPPGGDWPPAEPPTVPPAVPPASVAPETEEADAWVVEEREDYEQPPSAAGVYTTPEVVEETPPAEQDYLAPSEEAPMDAPPEVEEDEDQDRPPDLVA